jgi:hypothetical protein
MIVRSHTVTPTYVKSSNKPAVTPVRPSVAPKGQDPTESVSLQAKTEIKETTPRSTPAPVKPAEQTPRETPPMVLTQLQEQPAPASVNAPLTPSETPQEVAETAALMASILGPRLGNKLLDASNLVTIGGLRASNFHSLVCDPPDPQEECRLKRLNQLVAPKGIRVRHTGHQLCTDNLLATERISKNDPNLPDFSADSGWEEYDRWSEKIWAKNEGDEVGTNRQGALLGYPKRAIEDANKEFHLPLDQRESRQTGALRVPHSQSIVLTVDQENLDHPEILDWQNQWGVFLEDVYKSPSLKPFLGESEGKFSVPPETNFQHTKQLEHLTLKKTLGNFRELADKGASFDEAREMFNTTLLNDGSERTNEDFQTYLFLGQTGRAPYKQFRSIVETRPDWKTQILTEKRKDTESFLRKIHHDRATAPNEFADYDAIIAKKEAILKEIAQEMA